MGRRDHEREKLHRTVSPYKGKCGERKMKGYHEIWPRLAELTESGKKKDMEIGGGKIVGKVSGRRAKKKGGAGDQPLN